MRHLGFVTALCLSLCSAFGGTLVIPTTDTAAVGNDSSGSLAGTIALVQFQDIWNQNQLASVGGPILISQIAYRTKPNTGSINVAASSFSLFMSTTTVNAGTISATFAANRGTNFTQVDSGGAGTWVSSPGCTGTAPCPFDIVFNLSTPFLYNPAAGNLLIEEQVVGLSGTGTGQFDVQNYFSAPGAPVGEVVGFGGPTGNVEFSANVTRLTFTSVPEPASYAFTLCGFGLLALLRGRKT